MASLEEVTAWSLGEIKDGIRLLLPKDWRFDYRLTDDGLHKAQILEPVQDGYAVRWEDAFTDERLVLFGAYGYLLSKQHTPHPDSPWVRRPNQARDTIKRRAFERFGVSFGSTPDPEDLDPEVVRSVYEEVGKKT